MFINSQVNVQWNLLFRTLENVGHLYNLDTVSQSQILLYNKNEPGHLYNNQDALDWSLRCPDSTVHVHCVCTCTLCMYMYIKYNNYNHHESYYLTGPLLYRSHCPLIGPSLFRQVLNSPIASLCNAQYVL